MKQRLLLHIGLHKTATTYLQNTVWPAWSEVGYAGRPNPPGYRSSEDAVFDLQQPVLLLSNESAGGSLKQSYQEGRQWIDLLAKQLGELKKRYAERYELRVLLGLRRPDKWVLSIYKHYLKYGGVETLEGFLGLQPGTPETIAVSDLLVMEKVRRIEATLGARPFCFYLEEMRRRPEALSRELAVFAGVERGPVFVSGAVANEGVDAGEAEFCRRVNRCLINRGCLGRGYIRRNKTLAFAWARRAQKLGLLRARGEIEWPVAAAEFVRANLTEDYQATLSLIAGQRGDVVSELRPMLGEL